MTSSTLQSTKQSDGLLIHTIASLLTIFLLAFIDNGVDFFYQLESAGAWIGLFIYAFIILFGQALVREFFLIKYHGKHKTLLTLLIGIPVGVFFIYSLFYLIKG
jgi:hypothetical protein